MFQLNVRGEESRQLCVGTLAPPLQDSGRPAKPHLSAGPGAEEGASLSRNGHRQRWLFLGSLPAPSAQVCLWVRMCGWRIFPSKSVDA